MQRNCANCDCYNDWWSPISQKAKCDLTGNIIENPNASCDDWAPNRELELSILRKEVVCLKKENAELRQIMTDLENQPNQFCPVDKCKVVVELRSQVDELQAKLNLDKCSACKEHYELRAKLDEYEDMRAAVQRLSKMVTERDARIQCLEQAARAVTEA